MINLEHISFWYPNRDEAALLNLSLQIEDGEAVAVMGRNGSGKSTIIKLIAGLLRPTRGRIHVDGQVIESPPGPQQVGVLFQNPDNQMVAAQVEKEIAFSLENLGLPQNEMQTAVHAVALQFGITHLLDRLTSELSGGEKQRVALASVMVLRPKVLLLDEPDAFLDQSGREILDAELTRIRSGLGGLTELRITQSADVARTYSRLLVIDGGKLVADGDPATILADRKLAIRTGLAIPRQADLGVDTSDLLGVSSGERLRAIGCDNVSFAWPMASPVFKHLNLMLLTGEAVGLIGATGAGKSSMAQLLAGLFEPTEGEMIYQDARGGRLKVKDMRGRVALVLQQPERQFFLETCGEEVAFGPTNLGRPPTEQQIRRFLELVGLPPSRFITRDPFTLSAGEKRRLAFAAVLSMSPDFVLFDEPTAGLDGDGVGRFMALSGQLRKAGVGQLIISHDVELIDRVTDRVFCLSEHRALIELPPRRPDKSGGRPESRLS